MTRPIASARLDAPCDPSRQPVRLVVAGKTCRSPPERRAGRRCRSVHHSPASASRRPTSTSGTANFDRVRAATTRSLSPGDVIPLDPQPGPLPARRRRAPRRAARAEPLGPRFLPAKRGRPGRGAAPNHCDGAFRRKDATRAYDRQCQAVNAWKHQRPPRPGTAPCWRSATGWRNGEVNPA
jgi:hypothetical protein